MPILQAPPCKEYRPPPSSAINNRIFWSKCFFFIKSTNDCDNLIVAIIPSPFLLLTFSLPLFVGEINCARGNLPLNLKQRQLLVHHLPVYLHLKIQSPSALSHHCLKLFNKGRLIELNRHAAITLKTVVRRKPKLFFS